MKIYKKSLIPIFMENVLKINKICQNGVNFNRNNKKKHIPDLNIDIVFFLFRVSLTLLFFHFESQKIDFSSNSCVFVKSRNQFLPAAACSISSISFSFPTPQVQPHKEFFDVQLSPISFPHLHNVIHLPNIPNSCYICLSQESNWGGQLAIVFGKLELSCILDWLVVF